MRSTETKIKNYNLYAGFPSVGLDEATEDLALDPVNLAEFGAVIDLPFVRTAA